MRLLRFLTGSETDAVANARSTEPRFSTVAGLIGGMALATAGFYEPLPPWMPLPLAALAWWRLAPAWRGAPVTRVPQLGKIVVIVALVAALQASGKLGFGLDGAGALFTVLLWSKLLELSGARDLHRTAIIALFLVAVQLLSAQSLAHCLFAALSSIVLLGVITHYHLVGPLGSEPGGRSPWRAWRRALRTGALLTAQGLPFAAVMFLCVPRPNYTPGLDRGAATSGVSDRLEPGAISQLALSTAPAFRVEFTSGRTPAPSECYWRGVVLWLTNGSTWGRAQNERPVEPGIPTVLGDELVRYEITLQPTNRRWLYTLDCPLGSVGGASPKRGFVHEAADPVGSTRLYAGRSSLAAIPNDHPPHGWDEYRHVADDANLDPRIDQLARQLAAGAKRRDGTVDAELAIAATRKWFRDNGFVYTLQPGEMGANATGTFLFEKRSGFCEHYASAFSLLMRRMNVPSRVVVGYYGGEVNPIGGFLTVRQSNAHAWSEVWVDHEGWRRVDATADATPLDDRGNPIPDDRRADPTAFNAGMGDSWLGHRLRWLSQRWDYVEAQWDRWGLAYDQESLAALQRLLGLERLGALGPALMLSTTSLLLLALVLLAMRRRMRAPDPALRLYAEFCARMAHAGLARAPIEGPLDFARRAAGEFPASAERIARIAQGYAELRYGEPIASPARRDRLAALRRDIHALRPARARR
jgi:transglutaminase-like putative cysteine protease